MKPEDLERFAPDGPRARRIALEHLARYRFAVTLAAGRSVLDVGCGEGYGTAILSEAGAGIRCGVDLATAVVARARRRYGASGPRFVAADAVRLPFADGAFALVTCFEVIEHLERPQQLLAECRRVCAEDGLVLISTPNRLMTVERSAFHVREYDPGELQDLLEEHLPGARVVPQTSLAQSSVGEERRTGGWADELERSDYLVACWGAGLPDRIRGAGEHVRLADVERLLEQSLRHFMDLVDRVDADRGNLRGRLRQVEETLAGVEADRQGLHGVIKELEQRLQSVDEDRVNVARLLDELRSVHQGVSADRDNLRAQIEERAQAWAGVESDRDNLRRELEELRDVHSGVEADRGNLRRLCEELAERTSTAEAEHGALSRRLEEQIRRLDEAERETALAHEERDALQARVTELERDLEGVLGSRSWRLLRALGIAKR